MNTENAHTFERAGLGLYPFRVLTVQKREASCALCGEPLLYPVVIEDRDGKMFDVGCDCAERTGDAGLRRDIKNSEAYRALQRQKREARDKVVQADIDRMLADPRIIEHAVYFKARLSYCGMAGRAKIRKEICEWLDRAAVSADAAREGK